MLWPAEVQARAMWARAATYRGNAHMERVLDESEDFAKALALLVDEEGVPAEFKAQVARLLHVEPGQVVDGKAVLAFVEQYRANAAADVSGAQGDLSMLHGNMRTLLEDPSEWLEKGAISPETANEVANLAFKVGGFDDTDVGSLDLAHGGELSERLPEYTKILQIGDIDTSGRRTGELTKILKSETDDDHKAAIVYATRDEDGDYSHVQTAILDTSKDGPHVDHAGGLDTWFTDGVTNFKQLLGGALVM